MKKVTVENLAECTEQEVFDYIATHLLTQNEKAAANTRDCRYKVAREYDGKVLMCAAGCLLEGFYSPSFEHKSWTGLIEETEITERHEALISRLQNVHDVYDEGYWKIQLKWVAEYHGLSDNILLTL